MSVKDDFKNAEHKMQSALDALDHHFNTLRTGRASTALLDDVRVEAYGQPMPLNQVASVTTPDARSIMISPWDKNQLSHIERALLQADLGLTPMNDGQHIRLNIPALTEERRKELVKKAHAMAEDARVAIRNVRRHTKDHFEKMNKGKELTDDETRMHLDELQKMTDKFIAKVDEHMKKKEKEIMEV
jgi:ribosome recycling factor